MAAVANAVMDTIASSDGFTLESSGAVQHHGCGWREHQRHDDRMPRRLRVAHSMNSMTTGSPTWPLTHTHTLLALSGNESEAMRKGAMLHG
jgi:hypothetical protein